MPRYIIVRNRRKSTEIKRNQNEIDPDLHNSNKIDKNRQKLKRNRQKTTDFLTKNSKVNLQKYKKKIHIHRISFIGKISDDFRLRANISTRTADVVIVVPKITQVFWFNKTLI